MTTKILKQGTKITTTAPGTDLREVFEVVSAFYEGGDIFYRFIRPNSEDKNVYMCLEDEVKPVNFFKRLMNMRITIKIDF